MKVKIKYFAAMREATGKSSETMETQAITPLELLNDINDKYQLNFDEHNLKVAINEEYVSFTNSLSELDTIVFIPPVAGG